MIIQIPDFPDTTYRPIVLLFGGANRSTWQRRFSVVISKQAAAVITTQAEYSPELWDVIDDYFAVSDLIVVWVGGDLEALYLAEWIWATIALTTHAHKVLIGFSEKRAHPMAVALQQYSEAGHVQRVFSFGELLASASERCRVLRRTR